MPYVGGTLRHSARCVADHRNRSSGRGRVGPGRHQHGAQSSLFRYQPGAGRRRPEDRPVKAGGRDRDPEGAGGSRAAGAARGGIDRVEEKRSGGPARLRPQWLARRSVHDSGTDQNSLRTHPFIPEGGAPMGIGMWYEMYISAPAASLFKNTDPRGPRAANVSNSPGRALRNMPLDEMLANRHSM